MTDCCLGGLCGLPEGAEYSLTESALCPFPAEPTQKYAGEGEAMATAAHQTANEPKELGAYLCSWV